MAESSILDRIEQEARRSLLQNAIFRWESAAVIAGAILLTAFFNQPFAGWPVWLWPVFGLVAEIAVVVTSLTDKNEQQRVVEGLFREKYSINGIRDRELRAKLTEAEQYRQRIQDVVNQQEKGVLRDRIADTTRQVYDWLANMVRLARRIDSYRQDQIINRDQQAVPKEIKELTARINLETDPRVRAQMQETLESKKQFNANLDELSARMERGDLQLDHSLAALGTVYSQLLLIGSKDVDSDRAEQLRDDIRGEVTALQDLVESLNEVYSYQGPALAAAPDTKSVAAASQPARHDTAGRPRN